MKPSRSTGQLAIVLLSLSSIVSAWPRFLPEIDSLVVRQDNSKSSTGTQPTPTSQPAKSSQADLNTGAERPTDSTSDTATGTGDSKGTSARATSTSGPARGNGTRPTFALEDGAGGVTMVTPAPTAGTQLYKVGDMATWGWNYTSLQGTPTAIDVLAKCTAATRTWTLTQNMTFATSAAYFWDTGKTHKETPLVVGEYTLMVYDSETGPTAVPDPGYLAPFSGFTFGVYTPSPYTPNASGWKCVSCSGAVSDMIDGRALRFALTMCAVTVATFTWFVTGLGVL